MKTDGLTKFPAFTAKLGTDVRLVGFEMSKQEALGWNALNEFTTDDAGYFFALQERPGQLRFGLDEENAFSSGEMPVSWDQLSWEYLGNPKILNTTYSEEELVNEENGLVWGSSSASMASILTQLPVLFLVHSKDMIIP